MISKLILLIEDSESQAKVLISLLEERGFCVATVNCFTDLKALADTPNFPELFITICDVNLPDAPDGEAIEWLLDQQINTIVYTANISKDLQASMTSRSIIDYVIKEDANSLIMLAEQCEALWQNRQLKTLLVEDTPSSAEVMKHLLSHQQYSVEVATTGNEAIAISEHFKPDLVIIDLILPDMHGTALTRKLKKQANGRVMSIVGVSVKNDVDTTINFIKHGANDFIAKPFTPEEFICRINQTANLLWHSKKQAQSLEQHHLMNQMLSHDIRSPISMMIGGVKLLNKRHEFKGSDEKILESILHSGYQVIQLLEDALNLHKLGNLESTQKENIEVNALVLSIIESEESKSRAKDISIEQLDCPDLNVISNKSLLTQCILNVVDNAVKYSPQHTTISICAKKFKNHVSINVIDQGPGLNESDISKLFTPFAKLSSVPTGGETSTGLGLSIVKRIMQLLDGDITYDSIESGGSCFSIKIPTAL